MSTYVVVPAPRLKRDYVGRQVRLTRVLSNGSAEYPIGAVATIRGHTRVGSRLRFPSCPHCGVAGWVSAVPAYFFEFVEVMPNP